MSKAEVALLRQRIAELIIRDPSKAAIILTDWMNGAVSPKKSAVPAPQNLRKKAG
jgi:hypothetical protein